MLAAQTSTKESAMFHKSRYLTALAAGAVVATLACSDRPTTSAPPPTPRTPGALASRTAQQLQAKSEALAQHLARALAHPRSEEHTSELQSRQYLVCRLRLEK